VEAAVNEDTVDLRTGSPDVEKVGRIEAAKALSITSDIWLRGFMVAVVSSIFIWLNWQIIDLVRDAMQNDLARMAAKPPLPATERLITSNVIMSLIGATVVQTGVGFIAITSYLFPKRLAPEA
jgi:hypothetical protein